MFRIGGNTAATHRTLLISRREFRTTEIPPATAATGSLEQPDLKRLKVLLLRLGGTFVVAPPKPDGDLPELLDSGFVMCGTAKLKRGKASMCHQNVASSWMSRKSGIVGIGTGYALSEDGLRRQHSWGLLREGILETTEARVKYFGILLQGDRADYFAICNAPQEQ